MGKRGNGEGSVYQRPDGRWAGAVSVGGGKRRVVYAKTRAEAASKVTALLRTRDRGIPIDLERQSYGEYLDRWMEDKAPALEGASRREYETSIERHVKPALGRFAVAKLTPSQVQRFYRDIGGYLAPATIHRIHNGVVYPSLDQAVRWGIAARNVAALVDLPKLTKPKRRVLSRPQARLFVEAIAGHRLEALFLLAITTGLRQGELLGLRWQDVDLDAGVLAISQQYKRAYRGRTMGAPKSEAGLRQVAIIPLIADALRRHHVGQSEEKLKAGRSWRETDLVFAGPTGGPVNPAYLRDKLYYPLMARAGLPRLVFHELRHSAATILLAAGVPMPVVSRILGHSNIRITVQNYGHIAVEDQASATAAMGKLFG